MLEGIVYFRVFDKADEAGYFNTVVKKCLNDKQCVISSLRIASSKNISTRTPPSEERWDNVNKSNWVV